MRVNDTIVKSVGKEDPPTTFLALSNYFFSEGIAYFRVYFYLRGARNERRQIPYFP